MIPIKLASKLAGIFSSSVLLITGSIALIKSMSLDFDSVFYACKIGIPGALVAGFLGFAMGKVLQTAQFTKSEPAGKIKKDHDLLIDDLLVNDIDKTSNDSE